MKYCIKNTRIVNEGKITEADVLIDHGIIAKIDPHIQLDGSVSEINGEHRILMPGIIDDQVHFREPGYTHKACIASESAAAIAGGVTSFMEMPNTHPPALTIDLLEQKYEIARNTAYANYSFFMGASNDNVDEIKKVNPKNICGVKIFMGSSTGNMLVDRTEALEQIFKESPTLIATHCEDEQTIRENAAYYEALFGEDIPMIHHKDIRNVEACYLSSCKAIEMATKFGSRLHILHISTAKELDLFRNDILLKDKKITSELCVHHLWFSSDDYAALGTQIKCNPAIKEPFNREALLKGLLDDRLDIIATDHAPHTWEEKSNPYKKAPAGVPLVQHSLQMMMELYKEGKISLEKIVEKMCHAPAECFKLNERGYVREGYKADLNLVNLHLPQTISKENILYQCGWSPFEGKTFSTSLDTVFLNGQIAFNKGKVSKQRFAQRLSFH
jgi:dihydroorotase